MRKLFVIVIITVMSLMSCIKNDDLPSHLKGIVQFKSIPATGGVIYAQYSNNQVKFAVQIQLSGASQNLDVDVEYHLLDGTIKIGEGKVKVNSNLDGGLGIFWGSEQHAATVNGAALKGKTITVYLDPSNKQTASIYTSETYVNLYKKTNVLIP